MEKPAVSGAFLDKLLLRLKSGDARSIHLNALPGPFARIDVYDLIHLDPSLHLRFLNTLLTQDSFRFPLQVDPQRTNGLEPDTRKTVQRLEKKLNHLYYQEKEELAEHGYTSFAFGYPLLIKRDPENPERILKAPLFIWYLDIEKDRHRNHTWILSRRDDQPVIFNEALRAQLTAQDHIRTDALEALLSEERLTEPQLLEACRILSEQLQFPFDAENQLATLLPGTNKETIENLTQTQPWIRFSGIFGLYRTQKQSIIRDLEDLTNNRDRPAAEENSAGISQTLSPVELDPSQENLLHALRRHDRLVIQGPPGTGKSQSLSGLITTALLNGQTALVVCEKRTALDVLHDNLRELGLEDLCVLIEDVYTDRKHVVGRVRDKLEQLPEPERFRAIEFEETLDRFEALREKINQRIRFASSWQFGDDSWAELLLKSRALKADATVAAAAAGIPRHTDQQAFRFDYPEFAAIRKLLPEAENLFRAAADCPSVFSELDDAALVSGEAAAITGRLRQLLDSLDPLCASVRRNQANPVYDRLKGIRHQADKLLAIFSRDRKALLQQQAEDRSQYEKWKTAFEQAGVLPAIRLAGIPENSMTEVLPGLEIALHTLQAILQHETRIPAYITWRRFWTAQSPLVRQVLSGLSASDTAGWPDIFCCWYFEATILRTALQEGQDQAAEPLYRDLQAADTRIKEILPGKIRQLWYERQAAAIRERDSANLKYLYNLRRNKQYETRNTLRRIIHEDLAFFQTLFPVVLVNPSVCASVLPLQPGLFDLVILDEASQLKTEETYSSLYRGRTAIVSGDRHQMPPSNHFGNTLLFGDDEPPENGLDHFLADSVSLLEYAQDAGFPDHYLDFHYRSKHPKLIAFSNAAFYGNRLVPMPERSPYQPLHYYPVAGIYADGTNAEEAARIVEHLYRIEAGAEGVPSVGVATFNIFQRDRILDRLWEAAYADPDKMTRLEALLARGLFVKNLENIQGDERDLMLLSTTFGPDETGKFRQLFGPLTQEKGYQLLNVIVTRAKREVHVYCSVPEPVFLNFREELLQKGNTGKSVFYAYLAYVKACSEGNTTQEHAILETLLRNSATRPAAAAGPSRQLLNDQLFDTLQKVYGERVRQNYPVGGFVLPIVILEHGKPILSVETELDIPVPGETGYRYWLHREKILHRYGIQVRRIWSFDWWRTPEACLDNLHPGN